MLRAVQLAVAIVAAIFVIAILAVLLARGEEVGYSIVTAMVILVSTVPVGMPVVTMTVLAVGAREMAKEKAIVNRYVNRIDTLKSQWALVTALHK